MKSGQPASLQFFNPLSLSTFFSRSEMRNLRRFLWAQRKFYSFICLGDIEGWGRKGKKWYMTWYIDTIHLLNCQKRFLYTALLQYFNPHSLSISFSRSEMRNLRRFLRARTSSSALFSSTVPPNSTSSSSNSPLRQWWRRGSLLASSTD